MLKVQDFLEAETCLSYRYALSICPNDNIGKESY